MEASDYYSFDKIIDMDIETIDSAALNGATLPICSEVINKYVNISDVSLYRLYVENLNINNIYLKDAIDTSRRKMYDSIFDSVTFDGLLKEYKEIYEDIINGREIETDNVDLVMGLCGSKESIFKFLYDESSNRLHEILVDKYFEDNFNNFMINLKMMLDFIDSISYNLIDVDRVELYRRIYNYKDLSVTDKINLYNGMNDGKNYANIFYDDYRKCKEYAYLMYNDKVLNIDKMNKSNLSYLHGVDVYELDGENFMAFVHQTKIDRNNGIVNAWKEIDNRQFSVKSFSMIDQNHFDTIYGYDSYVVFGFSNLDIDRIIHVYHSDSFTDVNRGSDRVNEILNADDLMNRTKGYNEIFYLKNNPSIKYGNGNHTKLMPSYVMCYNYISDLEEDIAKKYKIPIVLLHTDKYMTTGDPVIDYGSDVYLDMYSNKKKK